MKAKSTSSLDSKVNQVLETLTELSGQVAAQKEKLNEVQDSVLWLVGEYKKADDDKIVSNFQLSGNIDEIEKLKSRTDRLEETLKLPKLKFSF